jgi:hypothetical protein
MLAPHSANIIGDVATIVSVWHGQSALPVPLNITHEIQPQQPMSPPYPQAKKPPLQ